MAKELAASKEQETAANLEIEKLKAELEKMAFNFEKTASKLAAAESSAKRSDEAFSKLQLETGKADKDVRIRLAGKLQVHTYSFRCVC